MDRLCINCIFDRFCKENRSSGKPDPITPADKRCRFVARGYKEHTTDVVAGAGYQADD